MFSDDTFWEFNIMVLNYKKYFFSVNFIMMSYPTAGHSVTIYIYYTNLPHFFYFFFFSVQSI